MGTAATVPQQVATFLQANKRIWFCDSCIQKKLGLKRPQQAQQATSALGAMPTYTRASGTCSVCGGNLTVIKAN
jgi:hypothetical protein